MTVSLAEIQDARTILKNIINLTPIISDEKLAAELGAPVFLKAECLQRAGSFKIRGAYNTISRLSDDEKHRGVVTGSAGNHAQGVAESAKILGLNATIVMPADAPKAKIQAARGRGANVRLYDRLKESREGIAAEIAEKTGATTIRPFDDAWIMAGQGTAGLEAAKDARANGVTFGSLICNASGGGPLNLSIAPFRVLAINPRIDLRTTTGGGGGYGGVGSGNFLDAGEARFTFGIVLPPTYVQSKAQWILTAPLGGGCDATRFSVIFEYRVPKCHCEDVRDWARQWRRLSLRSATCLALAPFALRVPLSLGHDRIRH